MSSRYFPLILLLLILTSQAATTPPDIKGASVLLIDAQSGEVLFSRNPNEQRPVGSTQKLLTALIVAENGNLNKLVTIEATDEQAEPTMLNLRPGDSYPREELLTALLVKSPNDVARALGRDQGGTLEDFAVIMNERAASLGAQSSHFVNPNGLPADDQYSTASDMARIARAAYHNTVLRPIMATKFFPFHYANGEIHLLKNTNRTMRENPFCNGMKTGYTEKSRHCLVTSGSYNGREVISVILGSTKERVFDDSAALLRWGLGMPPSIQKCPVKNSPLPAKHRKKKQPNPSTDS